MGTEELLFHEITLDDKDWMDRKFAEDDRNACEYTFANNFIWRKIYQVEVAEVCGCLIIRFLENDGYCYSYPVGAGDKREAVRILLDISGAARRALHLSPLSEKDKAQLAEWFPGQFLIESARDDFDYIYAREKLVTLAGKKLHGKRNHIARFKDDNDWSYEPMTADNLEECRTMTYSWMRMRAEKWNEEMEEEVMVLHEAFDHMQALGLIGGVLRKAGEIVAFSMGEPINSETFVVHFEKAYPDLQGAYPMINQQFAEHACVGYAYINREEDTGDPGLRRAKLSYYPEILLAKYTAQQSDVVYADPVRDAEAVKHLWEVCFGDEEEDIRYFLKHRMTDENMLVICEDGRPVSMASFLTVEYLQKGEYQDARYVYAVATLPEYRGRGYAARILSFAQEKFKEPLILAPAEESLIRYYEKLGFRRAFEETRRTVTAQELSEESGSPEGADVAAQELPEEGLNMEPVTAAEYVSLRDQRYMREGYVRWDENAVRYAMEVNEMAGGKTVVVPGEQNEFLMYRKDGDVLSVPETTLGDAALRELLPQLFEETGTSRAVCGQTAGMIWLPGQGDHAAVSPDGYLALTLE